MSSALLADSTSSEFSVAELEQAIAVFHEWEAKRFKTKLSWAERMTFAAPEGDEVEVPWWQITHQAADSEAREVKFVIAEAIEDLRGSVNQRDFQEAIEEGDVAGAMALFDWQGLKTDLRSGFRKTFKDIALRSGADTALQIAKGLDYDEAESESFFERAAEVAAQRVMAETRKALGVGIRRLLRSGFSPFRVRSYAVQTVGLATQQMNATVNLINSKEEAGEAFREIKKRVRDVVEEKVEARADNITRFETLNVAQAAQEDAVRQHTDVGALKNVVKVWVTIPDDSRCPICSRLSKQRRVQDDLFLDEETGLTYVGPPAHQRCRCGLRYLQARKAQNVGVFVVDIRTPEGDIVAREAELAGLQTFTYTVPFEFHQAGKHDQKAHGRKGGGKTVASVSAKDAEGIMRETEIAGGRVRPESIVFTKGGDWVVQGIMVGDYHKAQAKERFQGALDEIKGRVGEDRMRVGKIKKSERGFGTSKFISRSVRFGIVVNPLSDVEIAESLEAMDDELFGRKSKALPLSKPTKQKLIDAGRIEASERLHFHLSGKHDQKAHGSKGPKGVRGASITPSNDEEFLRVASNDGELVGINEPFADREAMIGRRNAYIKNQKQALGHLTAEQDWANPDAMVDDGVSLMDHDAKVQGFNSKVMKGQKASNAGKVASRMDEKLADVSTEELRIVSDEMNQRWGITQGDHFSQPAEGKHPLTDEPIPPGKRWMFKPRPGNRGVDPELVDEREAYMNDIATGLIGSHARTADNGFPPSTAVQDSVKSRILDKHPEWGEPSDHALGFSSNTKDEVQKFRNLGGGLSGRVVDAYVDSVYEETQSSLKAAGIDEVVLHRGTGQFRGSDQYGPTKARMNPIASHSRSKFVASNFGGGDNEILTTVVPRERIFSTAATGPGCLKEEEFIVVGGELDTFAG